MMKHRAAALLLAVGMLLLAGTACAQSTYVFPYEGFRYTQQESETVLTQTNLEGHAQLIESLGTTSDAIRASYVASGIVMEVILDEGGQIAVSVVSAGGFAQYGSMDEMDEAQLSAFAAQFEASGMYESCEMTATQPACVRLTSSAMYGSMTVYTLHYATLHLGRLYMLTQPIMGRAPQAEDDARMEQVLSGMMFLSSAAEPTPSPTPAPTSTPAPTPVPTPGVAQVIASEGNMSVEGVPSYTNDASLTISGKTDASAAVRVVAGEKTLGNTTAKRDGSFSLRVTLPQEGDLTLAVMTDTAEQMLSVRYEMAPAKLEITSPESSVFNGTNVIVKGVTEPEATVFVEGKGINTNVKANRNGAFSVRIFIDEEATETFTLRAKAKGFAQNTMQLTLTREYTEREGVAEFRKSMIAPQYDALVSDPERFADKKFVFRGKVMEFADYNGSPCALICSSNPGTGIWRDPVWVVLGSDMNVEIGNVATVYMTGLGQTLPASGVYTKDGQDVEAPVAKAVYCVEIK